MKKEEKNSKGKKSAFLVLLLVLLLGITVGFATLQASLNISGSSKIGSTSWDIGPDDDTPITCTGEGCVVIDPSDPNAPDPDDVVPGEEYCSDPQDQSTCEDVTGVVWTEDGDVYFKHLLEKPGDTFTFDVDYTNSGTLDAKVDTNGVSLGIYDGNTTSQTLASKFLTYTVVYVGGANAGDTPAAGDVLSASSTATFRVTVTYHDYNGTLPTAEELATLNGGANGDGASSLFTVTYVQA